MSSKVHHISNIPHNFLIKNSENLKEVTAFVEFKRGYVNSVISNYSPTVVQRSQKVPYSRVQIDKLVKKFVALGWAKRDKQGNLILKSIHGLYLDTVSQNLKQIQSLGKRSKKWQRSRATTLQTRLATKDKKFSKFKLSASSGQTLTEELQALCIRSMKTRKRLDLGVTSKRGTKCKGSRGKKEKKSSPSSKLVFNGLSYSLIGKVFGVSKSQAFNIISNLVKKGLITKIKQLPIFHGKNREALHSFPNAFLSKKGYVWSVPSNSYEVHYMSPNT